MSKVNKKTIKRNDLNFSSRILKNRNKIHKNTESNRIKVSELNKINTQQKNFKKIGFGNINVEDQINNFRNPYYTLAKSSQQCFYFIKFQIEYDNDTWNSFIQENDIIVSFTPQGNACGYRHINSIDSYISSGNSCTYEDGTPIQSGDINGDGIVNIQDVILVISHILNGDNLTQCQFKAADLNNDEIVNVLDVIEIIMLILNRNGDRREFPLLTEIISIISEGKDKNGTIIKSIDRKSSSKKHIQKLRLKYANKLLLDYIEVNRNLYEKNSIGMGRRDDMYIYIDVPSYGRESSEETSTYCMVDDIPYLKIYRQIDIDTWNIINLNLNLIDYPWIGPAGIHMLEEQPVLITDVVNNRTVSI